MNHNCSELSFYDIWTDWITTVQAFVNEDKTDYIEIDTHEVSLNNVYH